MVCEEDLDKVVRQDLGSIENMGSMDWEEIDKELDDTISKMRTKSQPNENQEETETFVKECIGYPKFENSVHLRGAVEAENREAGAAPDEKNKESCAKNTQYESIPIRDGKNIPEESIIHKSVVVKEATSNIGSYGLQSTETSSTRQVSRNWYFDTAIKQGYITIGNANDCTSTNTDIRVTSNKQKFISRTGDVNKHTDTHSGKKRFECEICKVRFTYRSHFEIHARIHTGEKPYECDMCRNKFRQKGNLEAHLRVHTGEKPYECHICKNRFSHKSTLRKHVRIHTGEKPYECHICKKRFGHKSTLQKHVKIHIGE